MREVRRFSAPPFHDGSGRSTSPSQDWACSRSSPLFAVVALYILVVSPGPIFFFQTRVGYLGRPFRMVKFRSMHVNADTTNHREHLAALIRAEAEGNGNGARRGIPMTKIERDNRIIPLGGILRKSCIDELPQLWNVFRGDMSLVGPRPAIPYEAEEYLRWHRARLDAVPGMTGLWQVSGKNRLTFQEMVSLDIRYAREMSLWLDARILILTVPAIAGQLWDSISNKQVNVS